MFSPVDESDLKRFYDDLDGDAVQIGEAVAHWLAKRGLLLNSERLYDIAGYYGAVGRFDLKWALIRAAEHLRRAG